MLEKDAYGSVAKFYDSFASRPMRGIRRSVAALAPAEGRIIDIGCGTGEQSLLLAEHGRHIIGVDASPAMLAEADKRKTKQTAFILGDGRNTLYPDGHFNAAVFSFVLHETNPEMRRGLIAEAKRLVGAGGNIVIAEYEPAKTMRARFLALGPKLLERLAGGEHYQGYRDWMRNGGLSGFCDEHELHMAETRKHFAGNILVTLCRNASR